MLKPFELPLSAVMPGTSVFEIDSERAGCTYLVWVTTPPGYDPRADRHYPVIFQPDGNIAAPPTIPMVQMLCGMESGGLELMQPIEPFIQVAVGYRPDAVATAIDFLATRARDLLPPGEPLPPGMEAALEAVAEIGAMDRGGVSNYLKNLRNPRGAAFLGFLGDELQPLIAKRWRVDPERSGFFGHSYGGLFAAWLAMQRHPKFPIVGSASPGIMVPNSKVYESLERERRTGADHTGRRLHLTVCETELTQPTMYQQLARQWSHFLAELGSVPPTGLTVTSHIVPYESHLTGFMPGWFTFLRSCYPAVSGGG